MHIGVVFPQTEIGGDGAAVRQYAQTVEQLGYKHVLVYDHVLGADPSVHEPWTGPYDVHTTFHEPFVLFGYLAGITSLELVTGVVILPQRQTALVAKQAAEVDLLTNGRFRFGIGVGWNRVEYDGLGRDFTTRGRRSGEQVELLRRLWTEQTVTDTVDDEQIIGAGLAPLPVQRPIPVWFGAQSPAAYRRAGRLGDGWFPQVQPGPALDQARAIVERAARDAGRDPVTLGMEGRVRLARRCRRRGDARRAVARGQSHARLDQHHERRPHLCRRSPGRTRLTGGRARPHRWLSTARIRHRRRRCSRLRGAVGHCRHADESV